MRFYLVLLQPKRMQDWMLQLIGSGEKVQENISRPKNFHSPCPIKPRHPNGYSLYIEDMKRRKDWSMKKEVKKMPPHMPSLYFCAIWWCRLWCNWNNEQTCSNADRKVIITIQFHHLVHPLLPQLHSTKTITAGVSLRFQVITIQHPGNIEREWFIYLLTGVLSTMLQLRFRLVMIISEVLLSCQDKQTYWKSF